MEPVKSLRRVSTMIAKSRSISHNRHGGSVGWDVHEVDVEASGSGQSIGKSARHRASVVNYSRRQTADHAPPPPYDPEQDAAQAREIARKRKKKHLSFFSMFKYSTGLDRILMILGAILAALGGVALPWMFYWLGKFLRGVTLHIMCFNNQPRETRSLLPQLFEGIAHHRKDTKIYQNPEFLQALSRDFFINVGYGALGHFLFQYFSCRCFAWAADRQIKKISVTYFESIIRKDMAWFDTYVDREFSHLMTEEITQIRIGLGESVALLIHIVATDIYLATLSIYFNYKLALPFYVTAPLFIAVGWLASYAESCEGEEAAKAYGKAGSLAEEILCNIKTVKIYQGETKEVGRFVTYLKSMSHQEFKWIFVASICSLLVWLFTYLTIGTAVWFGTLNINVGEKPEKFCYNMKLVNESFDENGFFINFHFIFPDGAHSLLMVFLAVVFTAVHAMDITYYIKQIQEARRRASDVFFLIDWKPRIDNLSDEGKLPKSAAIGRIEIDDVGARYPRKPKEWVLKNITMSIYPSQVIGFVGRSGSGKSTMLKMLLRLYDVSEGQIILDGLNIQTYNIRWLRSQIGLITQEPILFPISIESNLRCVKPSAKFSEIQEACKIAEIHERISELPQGYQTILHNGHRGTLLTTQEMRRICIARAIVLRPKILMIEDPLLTSEESFEQLLSKIINLLVRSTTILITSSRANALMRRCDHVYFFMDGRIAEHGTHLELLKQKGLYYKTIEETLDIIVESKPKFTSQLTSYKFAKSLRKIRERKRQFLRRHSLGHNRKSDSLEEILKTFHRYQKVPQDQYQYLLEHRGFGVGGFQRYTFAKTATFNPKKIGNILKKIKFKRRKRDEFKKKKRVRKSTTSRASSQGRGSHSVSAHGDEDEKDRDSVDRRTGMAPINIVITDTDANAPKMKNLLPVADTLEKKHSSKDLLRIKSVGSGGVRLTMGHNKPNGVLSPTSSFTEGLFFNTDWKGDDISICSEDSQEFWDDYCDKLEAVKHQTEKSSWSDIQKLVSGDMDIFWIGLGCISSICLGLSIPVYGFLVGKMCLTLDTPTEELRRKEQWEITRNFYILAALAGVAAFCQELFFSIAGKRMCLKLRVSLFKSMLKQDLEWYDQTENDISILCSRLASDTDCVQHVLLTTYGVVLQNLSTILVSFGLAYEYFPESYLLTSALLIGALFLISASYFAGTMIFNQSNMMDAELEQCSELAYRIVTSIRSCIILGLERHFLLEYKKSLKKPFRHFYLWSEGRCLISALARSLPWLLVGMFVYYAIRYLKDPMMKHDPSADYIFMVIELMILGIRNVGESLSLLTSPEIGSAAAHRILKILNSTSKMDSERRIKIERYDLCPSPPKIQLIDIHFKYNEQDLVEIIRGVYLDIEPNTFFAIVGIGQCGKTTLANIILRLTEPTFGKIFFHGEDIEDVNVNCVRRIFGLVEQDSGIIPDMTVAENIAFGDNSKVLSQEAIVKAAQAAQVHAEIMELPDTYNTKIGSLGPIYCSFTFKQRIALARALVRNPKILVIDDPAISHDTGHDMLMREAIENARKGRTLIILSQKIEPIRNADKICVMHKGEIVEQGTDSDLLDLKAYYYNMYMTQRLVDAAAELKPGRISIVDDTEVIDSLNRKAQNNMAKRKSSVAYKKFLSDQMERAQLRKKERSKVMAEEERTAEEEERKPAKSFE